ncbi:helix-turn-helix domain-containing protein [Empedobacter falsenii]|uniref:helix-turn-helix domain-containing protein n=1 Tax=Empedobacter falsenii TaxID=343874 RepID=UPI001C8E1D05|nr:helix-turn-helix transcriptional regulator [Empedobacter falsenii]MBY0066656.1 helix-turn-helix domain-containing protein [Empedobacter falsenii]
MDIGTIIKEARLKIGMSQKDLATQIGCDVSFLCKVEKNEKKLSLEKLELVSNIISIEIELIKQHYYIDKIKQIFIKEEDIYMFNILSKIREKENG